MTDAPPPGPDGGHPAPGGGTVDRATPTRTSVALVVVASVGAAALLMAAVAPTVSVLLAFADAVLFALSLRLVDSDRWTVVGFAAAGLLALFVGAGFVLAVGYTSLQLLASVFPVKSVAEVRPRGLDIISATFVVVGGTLAMIGGLTTVGNVLRAETVWAYAKLVVKTFVVPLAVATVMLFSTLLGHLDEGSSAPVFSPVFDAFGDGIDAVLAPVPGRVHAFTFCALAFATAVALARGVEALPTAELTTGRDDEWVVDLADRVGEGARRTAALLGALLPLALVELAVSPSKVESVLPGALSDPLVALTASHPLRSLLALVLVASAAVWAGTWALRRVSQTGARDVAVELTPFVGGAGVVAVVVLTHGAVLDPAVGFVADSLPGPFATEFTTQTTAVVDFYGSMAVTMTLAGMLVGLTALLSLGLALVTSVGLLPEDVAAPALAGGGTFVAAGFAAGVGVDPLVVLGGLVAALLAWDAGEFGVTLGREVGRGHDTVGPEAVHAAATLAVGVAGAVVAFLLSESAPTLATAGGPAVPFAVVAVAAGLFLIVAALR